MLERTLYFVVPGDIETRTGGYGYDRHIIAGLTERGWLVHLVSLAGNYPFPSVDARVDAARAFAVIPDRARVLVDGLAFGALPVAALRERERLRLVALVHHPLGLETGIGDAEARKLLACEREALTAAVGVVVTSERTVSAVEGLGVASSLIAVVEPGTEPAAPASGSRSLDGQNVPRVSRVSLRQDDRPAERGQRSSAASEAADHRSQRPEVRLAPLHMVCVASLVPRKGHDTLFDALAQLADLDWRLTCVGSVERDAEYAATLTARCKLPPLRERVVLLGELAGTALDTPYDEADLFVLPTHYEGYGMVVAEALARAIPVVSTRTGAIAELVGDDAGVLVPPADAGALAQVLRTLITDREQLARLRRGAASRRVSLPTWQSAAESMEKALERFTPA